MQPVKTFHLKSQPLLKPSNQLGCMRTENEFCFSFQPFHEDSLYPFTSGKGGDESFALLTEVSFEPLTRPKN